MSVAKSLPPVEPFFMQTCPLCGTKQRMMIRGLYVEKDKSQLYPDMGYSFCNCRHIFFTKYENLTTTEENFNTYRDPIYELNNLSERSHGFVVITLRDPYFCHWNHPHDYTGFNPRVNFILWDSESFIDECKKVGFELVSWKRIMDVDSKTPECAEITLRKP